MDFAINGIKPHPGYHFLVPEPIPMPYDLQYESEAPIKFGKTKNRMFLFAALLKFLNYNVFWLFKGKKISTAYHCEIFQGSYKAKFVAVKTKRNFVNCDVNKSALKAFILDLKTCIHLQSDSANENNHHIVRLLCANTSNLKDGKLQKSSIRYLSYLQIVLHVF